VPGVVTVSNLCVRIFPFSILSPTLSPVVSFPFVSSDLGTLIAVRQEAGAKFSSGCAFQILFRLPARSGPAARLHDPQ
jgi:hypothetical protein